MANPAPEFAPVNFVDSQASDAIGKIIDLAGYNDIDIRLARVKGGQVMHVLEADGVLDRIGTSQIYDEVYEAVADVIPDETDPRNETAGAGQAPT